MVDLGRRKNSGIDAGALLFLENKRLMITRELAVLHRNPADARALQAMAEQSENRKVELKSLQDEMKAAAAKEKRKKQRKKEKKGKKEKESKNEKKGGKQGKKEKKEKKAKKDKKKKKEKKKPTGVQKYQVLNHLLPLPDPVQLSILTEGARLRQKTSN